MIIDLGDFLSIFDGCNPFYPSYDSPGLQSTKYRSAGNIPPGDIFIRGRSYLKILKIFTKIDGCNITPSTQAWTHLTFSLPSIVQKKYSSIYQLVGGDV